MKKIISAIAATLLVLIAVSCKKLEPIPQYPEKSSEETAAMKVSGQKPGGFCPLLENKAKAKAGLVLGGSPVLYLDFDGENNVLGEPWGLTGTFNCPNPSFTSAQKDTIYKMVVEDYSPFHVVVVKSLNEFNQAGGGLKVRCIITNKTARMRESSLMAYNVGLAYVGSLLWSDNTPSFVFANEFTGTDRYKKIAESVSHELGHTFGLYHQSQPSSTPCTFIGEYRWPSSDLEHGALMGNPYQVRFSAWRVGPSISMECGQEQNDAAVIASIAGYRDESYSDGLNSSTQVLTGTLINATLINSESRHAFYKATTGSKTLKVTSNGNLNIKVAIYESPTATPVIYDDPSNGNVSVIITGKKYIQVFTEQPTGYIPSTVGGGYSIRLL